MKRGVLILVLLVSFSLASAATPVYDYELLTLEQTISNEVVIIPSRSNYEIEYFDLTLLLFPENSYRQVITDLDLNPVPDNEKTFTWYNPQTRLLELNTRFTLQTSSKPVMVKEKVPFPLESIPSSISPYLKSTETIDTNSKIKAKAQELAQNVDDLFVLEHKIARWVNQNIEYNLSTSTAQANLPASLVYDQGYGVCDELTNLFIAMNRALGVPARFVSGIAYSDSILFTEKWGNHGWAEVYFPEYGWIPYDVTYQEYGEVDATHIELQKEVDGSFPSVEYQTKGLYYNFEPSKLDFDTRVLKYGSLKQPKTEMSVSVKEKSVNFGSYNLIEVSLTNKNDYYIVEDVTLARALELMYFQPMRQSIVLKPYETKSMYWLIQVDPELDKNYIYTFPIEVFATNRNTAQGAFSVASRAETFNKNYMNQFIEEEEVSTSGVSVDCSYQEKSLVGETITLTCQSNEQVESLCFRDECVRITDTADFEFVGVNVGINTAVITSTQDGIAKKHFFTYEVVDQATIFIENLSITQNVKFEDFAKLKVQLVKNSSANPTNVTMSLIHETLKKEWFFSFLDKDKSFDIELPAQGFVKGENTFTIIVTYYDSTDKLQTIQASTSTKHANLTPVQSAIVYYNTYAAKVITFIESFGVERYYAELTAPGVIMILVFAVTKLFAVGIQRIVRRIPPVKKYQKK